MRMRPRNGVVAALIVCALSVAVHAAQHTLEEVSAGLRSTDAGTRLRAVRILKDGGHPEAAVALAAVLADPDDRVRLEAVEAERVLFTIGQTSRRRKIAFAALEQVPRDVPAEVLTGLGSAMGSPDPRVRLAALDAFGVLASPIRAGTQTVATESAAVRSAMAWVLEVLWRGRPEEQVAAAVAAGSALKNCGASLPATSDPSGSLCAETGNALVQAVNNRLPGVHRAAMRALGEIRYANAASALADQLSYYEHGPDAEAALVGLSGIGSVVSADIFKRTLDNPDVFMRRLAVEGLARAGEPADLADLDRVAQTERSNQVLLALHYAAVTRDPRAAPDELVAALSDSALRSYALQYLLDRSGSIAPGLARFLQHPDAETRMLVADVLGFSGDPTVITALEAAVRDRDVETAQAAGRAIERIRLRSAPGAAPGRR